MSTQNSLTAGLSPLTIPVAAASRFAFLTESGLVLDLNPDNPREAGKQLGTYQAKQTDPATLTITATIGDTTWTGRCGKIETDKRFSTQRHAIITLSTATSP